MIELQNITLDKKEVLERYLSHRRNGAAELSFANLYMWRKSFDMQYAIINGVLCFSAIYSPKGHRCFSFPVGFNDINGEEKEIQPVLDEVEEYFKDKCEETALRFCSSEDIERLDKEFPNVFDIYEDRDSFDYVYKTEDLIKLSGKKYHSKKNHINKFRKLYPDFKYCSLTSADTEECLSLFKKWRSNKEQETQGLDDEYIAIKDLMRNLEEFKATAAGIRVDNKLIAFSCGEVLDDKTVLIHLEHADNDYEGAFTVMNQQFLENQWQEYEYVNREEDMGIPGMRRAKESYRPVTMIKKYIAKIK